MALEHNIVIFLLCHSTKATGVDGNPRELGSMDIRDSSFVPQEADSTWIIQRRYDKKAKMYTERAQLKVCNHRHTGVMDAKIILEKRGMLFEEWCPGLDDRSANIKPKKAENPEEHTFFNPPVKIDKKELDGHWHNHMDVLAKEQKERKK